MRRISFVKILDSRICDVNHSHCSFADVQSSFAGCQDSFVDVQSSFVDVRQVLPEVSNLLLYFTTVPVVCCSGVLMCRGLLRRDKARLRMYKGFLSPRICGQITQELSVYRAVL